MKNANYTISLKRVHFFLGLGGVLISSFLIPMLSAYSSYNRSFSAVTERLEQMKTENAQTYAEKKDMLEITRKLDRISEDLSEIKGYVRAQNHLPLRSSN